MVITFLSDTQAIKCSQLKFCHALGYNLSNSECFISKTKCLGKKVSRLITPFLYFCLGDGPDMEKFPARDGT